MKHLFTACLLFLIALPSAAQITINRASYEALRGKSQTHTTYVLEENAIPAATILAEMEKSGANVTYDFRFITFPETPDESYVMRVLGPHEAHPFGSYAGAAAANFISRTTISSIPDTITWGYGILSDTEHRALGGGMTNANGTPLEGSPYFFEDGFGVTQKLPFTYGTQWEDVINVMSIPGVGTITTKLKSHVDAYGTILLPGGRSVPVLRVKSRSETTMDLPVPIPGLETPYPIDDYDFIMADFSALSVVLNESGKPVEIYYQEVSDGGSNGGGDDDDEGGPSTNLGDDNAHIPDGFALHANYPNPFNPTTTISYTLPQVADVKFTITDLLGREMASYMIPSQSAGTHAFTFDASRLSSGMYLYRMDAAGFSQTRKFTLVK